MRQDSRLPRPILPTRSLAAAETGNLARLDTATELLSAYRDTGQVSDEIGAGDRSTNRAGG